MNRRRTPHPEENMENPVLVALRKASEGLLYPSETDEPFTPFTWGKAEGALTLQKVARLAGASAAAHVEEQPLGEFFKVLTEGDDAEKYRRLQQVVGEQLSGARVFRLGSVNIDIYLVGKTKGGEWAGLETKSVET
jgi:Nuclease A inhibitor-like protein